MRTLSRSAAFAGEENANAESKQQLTAPILFPIHLLFVRPNVISKYQTFECDYFMKNHLCFKCFGMLLNATYQHAECFAKPADFFRSSGSLQRLFHPMLGSLTPHTRYLAV